MKQPALVIELDDDILVRYPLNQTRVSLGRASRCDIVLGASTGVSREHAQVLVIDDEVVVEDLGSRNGTYVNEITCQRRTLRPGDRISIGRYRLTFLLLSDRPDEQLSTDEIARLLGGWHRAAPAPDPDGCPLCGASGDLPSDAEMEENPSIDDDVPGSSVDPSLNPQSETESPADASARLESRHGGESAPEDDALCIVLMPD